MGESHKVGHLKKAVLAKSRASLWALAKKEWELIYLFEQSNGTCTCTHHPILEHCVIKNKFNHETLVVGNVCVQQFGGGLEDEARLAGQAFKRLMRGTGSANRELLDLAVRAKILSPRDRDFYLRVSRKHTLTALQSDYFNDIETKIRLGMNHPPPCPRCRRRGVPRVERGTGRAYYVCPSPDCDRGWRCSATEWRAGQRAAAAPPTKRKRTRAMQAANTDDRVSDERGVPAPGLATPRLRAPVVNRPLCVVDLLDDDDDDDETHAQEGADKRERETKRRKAGEGKNDEASEVDVIVLD